MDALEPWAMLITAEVALGEVEGLSTQQVGAGPVAMKSRGDPATETDLEIERRLRQLLTQYFGLPAYGEGLGGRVPKEHTAWVIDPTDGTTNYSNGFPLYVILLTLTHEGESAVGITSTSLLRRRIAAAKGGGTFVNGRRINIDAEIGRSVSIASGSIVASTDGTLPRKRRQLLLSKVGEHYPTVQITDSVSVGLDPITVEAPDDIVTFLPYAWDNVVNVLQISEAGGAAINLVGNPWRHDSVDVLMGT